MTFLHVPVAALNPTYVIQAQDEKTSVLSAELATNKHYAARTATAAATIAGAKRFVARGGEFERLTEVYTLRGSCFWSLPVSW